MLSYLTAFLVALAVVISTIFLVVPSNQYLPSQPKQDLPDDSAIKLAVEGKGQERVDAIMQLANGKFEAKTVVPIVARATADKDEMVRAAGDAAILKFGEKAVPILDEMLSESYFDSKDFAAACGAARVLGTKAISLLPKLQKAVASDEIATVKFGLYGMQAMGDATSASMDDFLRLLDHKDLNVVVGVCRILEQLGPKAAPATDKLVDLLETGVLSVRGWACIVLGAIGDSEKHDIVALLTKKLDAFTQSEKQRAMIGLGHLGPKAKSAVEKVTKLMNDSTRSCQPQAALTRWQITGDADTSLAMFEELLPTVDYKRDSIQHLGEMGAAAAPLIEVIVQDLNSDEIDIRELAVTALGKIGPAAKSTIPAIKRLLASDESDVLIRQAAELAISRIEAEPSN